MLRRTRCDASSIAVVATRCFRGQGGVYSPRPLGKGPLVSLRLPASVLSDLYDCWGEHIAEWGHLIGTEGVRGWGRHPRPRMLLSRRGRGLGVGILGRRRTFSPCPRQGFRRIFPTGKKPFFPDFRARAKTGNFPARGGPGGVPGGPPQNPHFQGFLSVSEGSHGKAYVFVLDGRGVDSAKSTPEYNGLLHFVVFCS